MLVFQRRRRLSACDRQAERHWCRSSWPQPPFRARHPRHRSISGGLATPGAVRPALLRAHPALTHGRLRTDRLGRAVIQGSIEVQRWWRVIGPVSAAAASFVDVARTALRVDQAARHDINLGIGARVSVPWRTGCPASRSRKGTDRRPNGRCPSCTNPDRPAPRPYVPDPRQARPAFLSFARR